MPRSYARPAAHRIRENKDLDDARADRVRDYCEARRQAKLEALRSVLGDLACVVAIGRDGEEIHDVCTALVRDRIRRLEGPAEENNDRQEEDRQEEDRPTPPGRGAGH